MKTFVWLMVAGMISLFSNLLVAQPSRAVSELEASFRQFQFQEVLNKGRFFLGEPGLSRQDSLTIYEYMLNAAYALNDTVQAKAIIDEILRTDPNFQPNPRITSPKIMEFYRWYRKNRPQVFPVPQTPVTSNKRESFPAISWWEVGETLLLPGSGEWIRQKTPANLTRMGVSAVLLGSVIYTITETSRRERDYLSATSDFDTYYDRYNRMYRYRTVAIITYSGWVLWHLYRLIHQNHRVKSTASRFRVAFVPAVTSHTTGGYFKIAWAL